MGSGITSGSGEEIGDESIVRSDGDEGGEEEKDRSARMGYILRRERHMTTRLSSINLFKDLWSLEIFRIVRDEVNNDSVVAIRVHTTFQFRVKNSLTRRRACIFLWSNITNMEPLAAATISLGARRPNARHHSWGI
jgi:hypothetical protein